MAPSPNPAPAARLTWMDEARGLAVLLVVLFHGQGVVGRFVADVPEPIRRANLAFAPFRMPLLMFLSGMLLARSMSKPTRRFFGGKARAIAWPYALWSAIFLVTTDQATGRNLAGVVYHPPTYLWYLWFLLAYYALLWALDRQAVPVWLTIAGAFVLSFGPDGYRFSRFFFLLVFFAAGHLFTTRAGESVRRLLERREVLVVAVVVALLAAAASASGVGMQYEPLWVLAPVAGIVVCLVVAPSSSTGPVRRVLGHAGRDSIVFYVTHFVVLWVVCWWGRREGLVEPGALYAVSVAVALAVGFAAVRGRRLALVDALFCFPSRAHVPAAAVPERVRA